MPSVFMNEEEFMAVNEAVMTIAVARKSHALLMDNVEEFDVALNELCDKWYEELKDKDEAGMAEFLLRRMLDKVVE